MKEMRKILAAVLSGFVVIFTVIAILAVWDLVDIEHLFKKSIATLFVLFISSAILLFIYSLIYKNEDSSKDDSFAG